MSDPEIPARRVLFLDIDGVLNSTEFVRKRWRMGDKQIDRRAVSRVNDIIRATGAEIVISSWWRAHYPLPELVRILRAYGLKGRVIGKTPIPAIGEVGVYFAHQRGQEIKTWIDTLDEHRETVPITSFVILDDNDDMACEGGGYHDRLVQTDPKIGLTSQDAERAIALLQKDIETA